MLLLALFFSTKLTAQQRLYTMAEATNGLSTTLATKGLKQPVWQPQSHQLFFNANNAWVRFNVEKNVTDTVLRLKDLNNNLFHKDSLKQLPAFNWMDNNHFYFNQNNQLIIGSFVEGEGYKTLALPENAENITVAENTPNIAYTLQNNLWLKVNGKDVAVTDDKDENIINGKAVHRDEFGITKGIFFSPKGNLLAYYHMDQTMVKDYPVIDWSVTPATVKNVKYPMAGGTSHQVNLKIYNPQTNQTITLKTGDPKDQYLTCVTWSPDEKYLYVALLNRDQNHLWLNQYDVKTGDKIKTLFEETDPKYVEPQHELSFLPNNPNQFVWWSERDGFMHLYLYNIEGKMIRQLTKGKFEVNELVGLNEAKKEIIYTAAQESAMGKNTYAVNWANGKSRRLDTETGWHTVTASDDGQYLLDIMSNEEDRIGSLAPTQGLIPLLQVKEENGKNNIWKKTLIRGINKPFLKTMVESPNPLQDFERPTIKTVELKAKDGTLLYGKIILPTHFDATKKYPSITYLYNGPHVQLIKNSFPASGNLWYEYLAQHGYIVFVMDGRGSSNRGKAFEQATFRQLGTIEMEDQLVGNDYLKSLPFVDAQRMGVHGWSFGGFMATSLMLRHPGIYKCAVAGGPVMDWKMYEIMYGERYMDTPETNKEGYENANLLTKVKNLKGKLLVIHGTQDATVVWQHSINFIQKCVSEGVPVDYFVYPGYEHNVRGKDRVHLMQKITDYFDANLK